MSKIFIDTGLVDGIAGEFDRLGSSLTDKLEPVSAAITRVQNSWDGAAGSAAAGYYNGKLRAALEDQSAVIRNYGSFLRQCVVQGYEQVETENTSLADMFK